MLRSLVSSERCIRDGLESVAQPERDLVRHALNPAGLLRHPEMVRVGKNSLIVFTFVSDEPEIYDRWETVALVLIESIAHQESLPTEG